MIGRHRDEGAALLTVLMLVALMAALIAIAFDRTGSALNRTRSRISAHEARFDLMSAEAIALARLAKAQGAEGSASIPLVVLTQDFSVPVPGGQIKARLRDGGNCFNLNALVTQSPQGALSPNPVATDQLAKLLEGAGIGSARAFPLAQTATTRVSAGMIDDPREMMKDKLWTDSGLSRVLPLLCALPIAQLPVYNINSLTLDQAPLVAAILPRGTAADAVIAALAQRPPGGFDNAMAFLNQPSLRGASPSGEATVQLSTRTDWFLLDLDAALGDAGLSERALIDARFRPVRMVRRIYGEP